MWNIIYFIYIYIVEKFVYESSNVQWRDAHWVAGGAGDQSQA